MKNDNIPAKVTFRHDAGEGILTTVTVLLLGME